MPDATPQTAAPAPAEQPAAQAVSAPVVETQQAAPAAEAAPTAPAPAVEPDELTTLKKRYADSSAEALRLYRENESLKATKPAPPAAQPPTYSPEQLETWKEQWLAEGYKNPEKAQEAAHQVRLIDAELRKSEMTQFAGKQTAAQAYGQLKAKVDPIIQQYKDELAPGKPIYEAANTWHRQAVAAGMPDNDMTATAALAWALVESGKLTQGVASKASAEATKNLNSAIKSAAAAGSGAANQNAAPAKDFRTMSREDFQAYRKSLGVGS